MKLRPAINTNIMINVIENMLAKFDIRLSETNKMILSVLIPGLIFRDGKIIIMSVTINQVNKLLKKYNDRLSFVSMLLALDIISDIDMYGTVTIPLALLLSKVSINKETISINGKSILRKKVLNNAVQTLAMSQVLARLNIPKELSIPIISVVLDLFDADIDSEFKMMSQNAIAFTGHKFSDTKKVLREMEFTRIILNIMILLVVNYIGLSMGSSLILVSVLTDILSNIRSEYKNTKYRGFMRR